MTPPPPPETTQLQWLAEIPHEAFVSSSELNLAEFFSMNVDFSHIFLARTLVFDSLGNTIRATGVT